MRSAGLPANVDITNLRLMVSASTYARGVSYSETGAVLRTDWDPDTLELHGLVQGQGVYQTTVRFDESGGACELVGGECSCPMEFDCKHVVALVLTAADPSTGLSPVPEPRREPTWEEAIGELIQPQPADDPFLGGDNPLAIQLSISPNPGMGAPSLLAKPMRPGKNGWVNGNLSWSQLSDLHPSSFEYRRPHVHVLQEIYAVYRAGAPAHSRLYYSGNEKTIDLATFHSPTLWALLDQAAACGVDLVHPSKGHRLVEPYGRADFGFDIVRESGSLVVRPVVRIDEAATPVTPVAFIGADAHGLAYTTSEPSSRAVRPALQARQRIRLARFTRPVPQRLHDMALAGRDVTIPTRDADRFVQQYFLHLRQASAITSSDGSFTPPEVSRPALAITAGYGLEHELVLDLEWQYRVDGRTMRTPLGPVSPTEPYRDPDTEQALLNDLRTPLLKLGFDDGGDIGTRAYLDGLDTMRFTTEVLPLLNEHPDVEVVVQGRPADYREASDSVTIGVAADETDDPDWFDLNVSVTVDDQDVPLADVITALARNESYLLLPDGAYFALDKPELRRLREVINEARALRDGGPKDPLKISRYQAGLWDELVSLGVVDRQADEWRRQVEGLLSLNAVEPVKPPSTLFGTLRPYQVEGFHWLSFLWQHGLGGILADDMGLGKTVQTLAMICQAKELDPAMAPVVIVAPTSVVPNWAAEAARFAPELRVAVITETQKRRGLPLHAATTGADIVVTSYTLFRLEHDYYERITWSGMVLDEAQHVKNHQSKAYQAVRRLPAPFKLAITGTPLENNLMELWSMLSITAPGVFPSPNRFQEYFARPIEKGRNHDRLAQLRQRIKPLVKRRTKEQVAPDLPDKQEQVLEVDLHPKHRAAYDRRLQRERQKILGLVDDIDKNRFTILRSLTLLRQLSLHAGLVDDDHRDLPSAKIDVLLEHLDDVIGSGHRALVFSQFTGFLATVRKHLDAEGIDYVYLDGSTRDRGRVLDEFKSGAAPVFLISLKAGGFGLNLTEADYVFLLDPWWNPATEAQAVDRTHRIGQTRNVMVYRLIANDTIEQKVMALKQRKSQLFSSVLDDGNAFGTGLTADDIRHLFT